MSVTYAERPWIERYDEGMPTSLDFPDVPLHHFLKETAKRLPKSPALITTASVPIFGRLSNRMTYEELDRYSDAMAAGLVEIGLKKGDKVAIVMPNCVAFAITFFATLKAGGVVAATNPTYPVKKMEYQINDSDAKIIVTLTMFYDTIKGIQANTRAQTVIVANIKEYLPTIAKWLFTIARERKDGHYLDKVKPGDHWFQDVLARCLGKRVKLDVTPDDIALFQYTGGTTGVSKAAVAQHKALVANMLQLNSVISQFSVPGEEETFLGAIPMFHVYGLVAMLNLSVYLGGKIVLIPNARDINEVVACIDHYKPSLFPGVPALYNAISNNEKVKSGEINLWSLRYCISGSAPLPVTVKEEFERLSGSAVREGFGMSEAPTATHTNPIKGENRTGSIGLPLPEMDMRIVSLDDDETDVPVGEVGELLMTGPNLMIGYHGMPTETANTLREKDGKTWLYTGDIAKMDEDGYFYIVDRKKDMALIGGFNVYPTEVEDAIKRHPDVVEVGVAAVPHPTKKGQEALKAWVVKQPRSSLTDDDLIAHCEGYLAPYAIPRRISFIDELPKSAVGKTLRRELVRLEMETSESAS
jgi:long-chain acyl-CoA synthetase